MNYHTSSNTNTSSNSSSEKADIKNEIALIPASSGMVGFITNTWLKSYRNSAFAWGMNDDTYYKFHHDIIANLIVKGSCLVATLKHDPSHFLGYICYDVRTEIGTGKPMLVIHYIYVKRRFRDLGLASHLLQQVLDIEHIDGMVYAHTHRTKCYADYNAMNFRKPNHFVGKLTYNPYLAFMEIQSLYKVRSK